MCVLTSLPGWALAALPCHPATRRRSKRIALGPQNLVAQKITSVRGCVDATGPLISPRGDLVSLRLLPCRI